ncbi:2-hydroxyacid dehydrogenase [Tabrizicola sp.]|jgi:lactate dehydrogenase-like 2-hydroxyacid dehydrogenase|uniref:2-hydroxyacid dehydrogenase n=1 Tax=Tabrizicola sp. TaxID=2005166 RepID=UPI0025D95933|nr:2-hydroxyacid dehydrogenase [Tabrizicola sp.]MBY0350487.1 2-hydroxyacid dehydrogenase [Tabrizicola sp.]
MAKPHVLQVGPYPDWDQTPLDAAFTIHRWWEAADKDAFLAKVGPDIRAIATRGDLGASEAMIAACPKLEMISVFGVGYDSVHLPSCRARGIRVTNTPDVLTDDVADLAVAMLLSLVRQVGPAEAWVRSGDWAAKGVPPLTRKVTGTRAGILGLGRIGAAIGRRLQGFGMDIAYSARSPKPGAEAWTYIPDAVALAERSDHLFIALAATPETRHIVNARVLQALGPEGTLINISRAANVDETALLDALETGQIAGAALDVFEGEPNLNPRFLTAPNILLQPHHGSGTIETRKAMGKLTRDNLTAHFAGQPLLTPVPL